MNLDFSTKKYNKSKIIFELKAMLREFEGMHERENKIRQFTKMMDFLVINADFVHDTPKLSKVIKERMNYFAQHNNFRLDTHYEKLFGEPLLPIEPFDQEDVLSEALIKRRKI